MSWSSASYHFTHSLTLARTRLHGGGGAVALACLIGSDADAGTKEDDAKPRLPPVGLRSIARSRGRHGAGNSHVGSIRSRRAWRQRCDRGDGARLHVDLAAIVIDHGRRTGRSDHDRVTDIGIGLGLDGLKALALIDGQIAGAWLDHR